MLYGGVSSSGLYATVQVDKCGDNTGTVACDLWYRFTVFHANVQL